MGDLGLAPHFLEHEFGKLEHGELTGIAKVHRADDLLLLHETHESVDKVVDIAERTGLGAFTINGEIFPLKGLDDEVGDDTAVIGKHAWAVGVEDADDADIDAVLAMVVEEECLGGALPLVVAGAQADGIHMAPVGLGLGMDIGIAIDLGGGGLEDTGFHPLCQSQAVDGPDHGGLHRLDGVVLVVGGGSWAGEVVDAVNLELERVDDVMAHEFEAGIADEMLDVRLTTSEEIIKTDNFMSLLDKTVAEMGTKESGSAGNENSHWKSIKG